MMIFYQLLLCYAVIIVMAFLFYHLIPFKLKRTNLDIAAFKFRKLTLSTLEFSVLTEDEMKNDILTLMDEGYEMTSLKELFDYIQLEDAKEPKRLVILNCIGLNIALEKLAYQLFNQNSSAVFYRQIQN